MPASRSEQPVDAGVLAQTVKLLTSLNKETVKHPTAQQINALARSSLAPELSVLCEYVVGPHEAILVRRHLHELQRSNLPKSIMTEVFSPELVQSLDRHSGGSLDTAREKTSSLETKCKDSEIELSRIIRDVDVRRKELRARRNLNQTSTEGIALLEKYIEQMGKLRGISKTDNLDDIRQMVSLALSHMESTQDERASAPIHSLVDGSDTSFPSWNTLLGDTLALLNESVNVDIQSSPPPFTNELPQKLMELQNLLARLKATLNGNSRVVEDHALDQRLEDAAQLGGCPGRDDIQLLARDRARRRIFESLRQIPDGSTPDNMEQIEGRTRMLHSRTSSKLQIVQSLLQRTRQMALLIPEEVRGEIIPLQEELHNLRRDLKGSVDSCRCDMEASDRTKDVTFTDEVCAMLGLPLGSRNDVIYSHVVELLQTSKG